MRPTESFVGQPIRSLQTMLRVIGEQDPQAPSVVPDGIYGQHTMTAVSSFQRQNGLPITGITDQNTWDAIVLAYETSLIQIDQAVPIEVIWEPNQIFRLGDSSPYLYLLQAMLLYLAQSHSTISVPSQSGVLDTSTAEALAAFQLLAGLPPTGELDRVTWKYLVNQFTLNANRTGRF